jgi:vancomycin resistance protein YoaR
VTLTWSDETLLEASAAELGAAIDVDELARTIDRVGRRGDFWVRIDACLQARRGAIDVPVRVTLPVEAIAERLLRVKEERDTPPSAARLDFASHAATAHADGRYLDVYAAAEAAAQAFEQEAAASTIAVPAFAIAPRASSQVVAALDVTQLVSRFETRFGYLGDQRGRAQNIQRAAGELDGVVLMPQEVVSFNANVGPRSVDNGFAEAPEIYKGEIRPGIGGGTCQVAGTLHAAAYLGGIDVVERSNHSRPSGYIRMGLDATVVYPTVDLKLRNPYDFPIVVHSTIDRGTLSFALYGRRRPATVRFDAATVGTSSYKRKIEEVAALPEGRVVLKQHGIPGYSVRKTRTILLFDGTSRVEVTTDTYPPTFEIYQVGPGTDLEVLPPLPDKRTAAIEGKPAAAH